MLFFSGLKLFMYLSTKIKGSVEDSGGIENLKFKHIRFIFRCSLYRISEFIDFQHQSGCFSVCYTLVAFAHFIFYHGR